jgi:tetratricopeptide (TPR) repeat protein
MVRFGPQDGKPFRELAERGRYKFVNNMTWFPFLSQTPQYWFDHGKKQKKYAYKIKSYEKALNLDPYFIEAWIEKAHCVLAFKGKVEALETYNSALEIEPKNVLLLFEKACLLHKMKKMEESLKVFDYILSFEPRNVFVLLEKADLLKDMGNKEESLKVFNYILSFEPDNYKAIKAKKLLTIFSGKSVCQKCGIEIFHQNSCPLCKKTFCWRCLDTRFHDCIKESIPKEGIRPGVSINYLSNGHIEARK